MSPWLINLVIYTPLKNLKITAYCHNTAAWIPFNFSRGFILRPNYSQKSKKNFEKIFFNIENLKNQPRALRKEKKEKFLKILKLCGDSDVGDIVMLVTLWWWLISDAGVFFLYVGDFLNVLNRSPKSWMGHQHLKLVTNPFGLQHPSPTSM